MPIKTSRLLLRPYERDDARQLGALVSSSFDHLRPWMPWAVPHQTMEKSLEYRVHPRHEGHGIVTEAARALTTYAFDVLRAERVEIRLDPVNVRSRAVPQRLNFMQEGTLRRSAISTDGELRDTEIFAVTRADWSRADV